MAEALEARFDRLEEDTGCSYSSHLSVAGGIKVGGCPRRTQEPNWPACPTCTRLMDHLLTINSAEFDGESCLTWLPVEDTLAMGTIWDLSSEERAQIQPPLGSCSST